MWAWGYANILTATAREDVVVGTTIDGFISAISSFNSVTYFHNLKFDGRFIMDWLLNNGYAHTDERNPPQGFFKSLISNMGQFYSITVYWNNGNTTEFRDSFKKIPLSVKRTAKSFKLEESKGEIDYHAERPVGHELTDEEYEYLCDDVLIMAKAMRTVIEAGMTKLTLGADSLHDFKTMTGPKEFQRMFPIFSLELDSEIRRSYRGGFTYRDPRFANQFTRSGHVLDVNSLYPYIMRHKPMPYGYPEYVEGYVEPTENRPLTIFAVTIIARIKPGHIPCIQIKGSSAFAETEYVSEITEPTELMVTNVDFALYNDHYDIKVLEYAGGWRFHATEGIFDEYIDKWTTVKVNSVGGQREIAKLHLNSLYGKFATNPMVSSKYPELEGGVVRLHRGPDDMRDPVYTAVGVFITSFAREKTIRAAQANYGTFAYADTDSLHLLTDTIPTGLQIHPSALGAWKHEYNFESGYYVRAKQYFERGCVEHDGTELGYVNRVAGMPTHVSGAITHEHLSTAVSARQRVFLAAREDDSLYDTGERGESGAALVVPGKKVPLAVRGGLVLQDIAFDLKLH